MAATIICKDSVKNEIREYLLKEIGDLMENIRESVDSVAVTEFEQGLEVEFPMGEIYGYASDYVQSMPYIFKALKKEYNDIAIRGLVYEYETIQEGTFGPLFYCSENDAELTVTYDWQECANCGKIVEGDAVYNSSQHDFEEGNLLCLCSPTCMLEYALSKEYGEVQPNDSLDDKERDAVYDSDDEDKALKKILWKRITLNLDEYAEDFMAKKERIAALANKKGVTAARKKVLVSILEKEPEAKKNQTEAKTIEKIDFAESTFVVTGFGYEMDSKIRTNLYQRKAVIKDRISAKVQYLIIPDGKFAKNGNYKKAEELISKGNNIAIITYKQYKKLLREYDEAIYGSDGADVLEQYSVTIQNDRVYLEGYVGDKEDLVLPEHIGPYPIVQIAKGCFKWSNIKSITIPETFKELPEEAFAYCNELASVVLPNSLTAIEERAFISCRKLQEIDFPEGLIRIGKNAFRDCENLQNISLPSTIQVLEDGCFSNCKELKEVYIPASVQSILAPFYGCEGVSKMVVDPANPVYDSRDNCNAIIETASNKVVMGCVNTVLPATVTCIGEAAFSGFTALTDFVVPEGITKIESAAFDFCCNLESLKLADSVETIGNFAFSYCRNLCKIELPANLKEIHVCAFSNCDKLTELVVGDKLTTILDLDNAWMYNCRINKIYGSKNSIAKEIAEKRRGEYIEIES